MAAEKSGEGKIREIFNIQGRGRVLVIEEGFTGKIARDGLIENAKGRVVYEGPDFLDRVSANKSWITVTVDPAHQEQFAIGDSVTFYSPV